MPYRAFRNQILGMERKKKHSFERLSTKFGDRKSNTERNYRACCSELLSVETGSQVLSVTTELAAQNSCQWRQEVKY